MCIERNRYLLFWTARGLQIVLPNPTTPALTCEVGLVDCSRSVPVAMKPLDDSVPKIRFIKKRITASLGFRPVEGALPNDRRL